MPSPEKTPAAEHVVYEYTPTVPMRHENHDRFAGYKKRRRMGPLTDRPIIHTPTQPQSNCGVVFTNGFVKLRQIRPSNHQDQLICCGAKHINPGAPSFCAHSHLCCSPCVFSSLSPDSSASRLCNLDVSDSKSSFCATQPDRQATCLTRWTGRR